MTLSELFKTFPDKIERLHVGCDQDFYILENKEDIANFVYTHDNYIVSEMDICFDEKAATVIISRWADTR